MQRTSAVSYRRYAAHIGSFLPTFRDKLSTPPPRVRQSQVPAWPSKMGQIGCPETSVNRHRSTQCNIAEEWWFHLEWVHTCNVTAYCNTVSWQCGRDSWPRNVSKVGYAVTLRACSVCCRYLAVASKEWYGYGRSRCGRATCTLHVHTCSGRNRIIPLVQPCVSVTCLTTLPVASINYTACNNWTISE
jgi:hypothetical protein